MEAVFIERAHWRRAQPHFIINTFRGLRVRNNRHGAFPVNIRPGFTDPDPSELSCFKVVYCVDKMRLASLLLSYLDYLFMFFYCPVDYVNLSNRVTYRFFKINMFSSFQ